MVNWIVAIASSVSAIGIIILWWQLQLLSKQIKEDHERSRHQMSILLMRDWVGQLERETSAARKFAETLDKNQASNLWNEETLEVNSDKQKKFVEICLAQSDLNPEYNEKNCTLKEPAVSFIRWQVVRYLNSLETMLSAWRHNVASRNILEEELHYLFDKTKGHEGLLNIRQVAGINAFPAIAEFEKAIKNKEFPSPGLPPTGNV